MEAPDQTFRDYVAEIERQCPSSSDIVGTWASLCEGSLQVRWAYSTPERHYFVLARRAAVSGHLGNRRRRLIEGALRGSAQKSLSIDLGLANSTVATALKECLRFFGFDCLPSRLPVLLLILAQAADGVPTPEGTLCCDFVWKDEALSSISTPRPETALRALLSPAEYATVSMLIDGETHKAIAARRQRSPRTIANQLASAFHRLGVSGRSGVLLRLVRGASGA